MPRALTSSAVIAILIGAGYLARRLGILATGDERVLNGLVYYFAFPAFLLLKLAETDFGAETLRLLGAGAAPIAAVLLLLGLARLALGLPRETFFLLAVGSIFGSLAFFGIPFIEVAIAEEEAVRFAVALIAAVAPFTVGLVLVLLELYGMEGIPLWRAVLDVLRRFSRNPLILSLAAGVALSLMGLDLPPFLRRTATLLGDTAAPVALFSLGVFLYGRRHRKPIKALGIASLRLLLLPAVTLAFSYILGLSPLAREVAVLMNGTPIAVNMIVLSARYRFFEEEMATMILLSSVGALLTMNLWTVFV